jgi:omega-amidase
MSDNLRITLIQTSLHWENIPVNLKMFTDKIAAIEKTDLIILPEMFSTGFSMNAEALAEDMNGPAVQWMKRTAEAKGCVLCGSLLIKEGDQFFNRLVWMQPDGAFELYDKRHLFSLSTEPQIFTAGSERLIVTLKGWKICPMVCYDLRFPVWSRNTINAETDKPAYDLLVYVANWPEQRNFAWKSLLVARAIENQAYVAGVNRIGQDITGINHSGDTMVLDAVGSTLYTKEHTEDIFTLELDFEALQKIRERLPFLKSADEFELNNKKKIKSH